MNYDELIAGAESVLRSAIAERDAKQETLMKMRSDVAAGQDVKPEEIPTAIAARDDASAAVKRAEAALEQLRTEKAEDDHIAALRSQVVDEQPRKRAYDQVARVGQEARTYNPGVDRTGAQFLSDVLRSQLMGDTEAQQRLGRHMAEERVERAEYLQRTLTGTGAFAGLVVPQYLTDLQAPYARSGRPFADAVRKHVLPADGMQVHLSRSTTATTAAVQTQGSSVSETNFDDTLLSIDVLTNAGSQTVTRQAAERGTGVLDVVLEDLVGAYHSNLDNELLNQATNGLATVGNAVTFTDNTDPTAIELYPFIAKAAGNVETALKNRGSGDTIVVMHPRRWWWLQAGVSSSMPLLAQNGVPAGVNSLGADYAERYGAGFRGVINGLPVITDSNIVTNLGTATNQDEVYVLSASESHLWESPGAPLFIRTDTGPNVKALGIDLVVFGYFAMTHVRYSQAQRITGSGLVAPA